MYLCAWRRVQAVPVGSWGTKSNQWCCSDLCPPNGSHAAGTMMSELQMSFQPLFGCRHAVYQEFDPRVFQVLSLRCPVSSMLKSIVKYLKYWIKSNLNNRKMKDCPHLPVNRTYSITTYHDTQKTVVEFVLQQATCSWIPWVSCDAHTHTWQGQIGVT